MHYDPMIAKLVVWGENRAAALVKLKDCLSKFQVYLNLVSCLHCTRKRVHNVLLGALSIYSWPLRQIFFIWILHWIHLGHDQLGGGVHNMCIYFLLFLGY